MEDENLNGENSNKSDRAKCGGVIESISAESVHKICSGQVVASLSTAVKELVENSLDAGATIINIRLKEYGADLIEVCDNGSGVLREHFQALTLKHYTSKLRNFNDLEYIETLGFRGEALSSLCALSELSIITRHSSAEIGSKITYNRDGKISDEKPVPRDVGTTLILENLFSTLPVRRRDFLNNLKRAFTKMCQILYAYCLVSKGVRYTCVNITAKGSRNSIVATEGQDTVKSNIINIFGAKQVSTLIEVNLVRPEEHILAEYGIMLTPGETLPFSFEFLISSVMHGSGRSATDRQFYYINSRPCEPKKIMKLINDVYKQFNSKQFPFVFLNITSISATVDVNITPDKRQIFLEKENYLLAILKASLIEAFKMFPSTFNVQNMDICKNTSTNINASSRNKGVKRSFSDAPYQASSIVEKFKKRSRSGQSSQENSDSPFSQTTLENIIESKYSNSEVSLNLTKLVVNTSQHAKTENLDDTFAKKSPTNEQKIEIEIDDTFTKIDCKPSFDVPVATVMNNKYVFMETTIDSIQNALKNKAKDAKDNLDFKIKFRSKISPENNKAAEEELQKQIDKEDFKIMEIIGQFNLGFIITKLNNDLFIIDQHATDEKYNFEQLQMMNVLESQRLVRPIPLELTAGNECILIENEPVFNKSGFTFMVDHEAPCTKKVSMVTVPVMKNIVFGKDDVIEMLFMLHQGAENPNVCRPSKMTSIFASKACRKSVMIGSALSNSDMRKLIDHMSQIDDPWSCPHGRPTMRHLVNLKLIDQ